MNVKSPPVIVGAGAATLFVELALIRYVPGQLRVLGYFSNFVLLAAFLGFGLGMLASTRWPDKRRASVFAPLSILGVVGITELGRFAEVLPSPEHFLFVEYVEEGVRIPLFPFLALSFALLALSFVPLGHLVGRTLDGDRPLYRYGLNIVGSLIGIALFVVLAGTSAPPWLWMCLAGAMTLIGVLDASNVWRGVGVLCVVGTTLVAAQATEGAVWSPYQKITTANIHVHPERGIVRELQLPLLSEEEREDLTTLPESVGFVVRVNDDSFQKPVDLRDENVARYPVLENAQTQYDLPFSFRPPPGDVLVLGAGTGNDVAAALRAGASRVDAVEIDPEIVALGRRHPERPYDDERVHVHIDDARSFLNHTDREFDTIVFGLLDSHVLLSSRSNVRLDSFVFTRESFELARERLRSPRGALFVSHAVGRPWFVQRMRRTLDEAFGKPPYVVTGNVYHPVGVIYAAGEQVRPGPETEDNAGVLEDDWPFVYLKDRSVPTDYLIAMALMALIALLGVRGVAGKQWKGVDLHFFALGAGFLLLETRGLTVLALHLGSTWSVNAAVFAAVLVMALLATVVGARFGDHPKLRFVAYALLALCLVLNMVVPVSALSGLGLSMRVVVSAALIASPLFASGLIFASSLKRTGSAEKAVASNLLGALLGGLVEYTAMMTGLGYLVVLAAAFYGLAMLADMAARRPA